MRAFTVLSLFPAVVAETYYAVDESCEDPSSGCKGVCYEWESEQGFFADCLDGKSDVVKFFMPQPVVHTSSSCKELGFNVVVTPDGSTTAPDTCYGGTSSRASFYVSDTDWFFEEFAKSKIDLSVMCPAWMEANPQCFDASAIHEPKLTSDANPCCQTCPEGYEKYISIPHPDEPNHACGECCLQPGRLAFWKRFEPALAKGDCASLGFTEYDGTETDGFGPLSVTNDRYFRFCPSKLKAVYTDIHDGDKKEVHIADGALTIRPSGNNETWVVHAELDLVSCSAVIDFNVPGKPGPPPVNLTATLRKSASASDSKTEFEFTDPSGTLAEPAFPLNLWVELEEKAVDLFV